MVFCCDLWRFFYCYRFLFGQKYRIVHFSSLRNRVNPRTDWFIFDAAENPTSMTSEVSRPFETLATVLAFKWPLAGVVHQVELETGVGGESFSTLLTFKRLTVASHVNV